VSKSKARTTAGAFAAALALAAPAVIAAPVGKASGGFDVVVLGARGGIQDGNLSSYLVRAHGDQGFLACDAGTVVAGLTAADRRRAFADLRPPAGGPEGRIGWILTDQVKGYLISHAHLDHIAGLIIVSPEDGKKPIYALPSVHAKIAGSYFNNDAWSNFADTGTAPRLGKYHFEDLQPGQPVPAAGTAMTVTGFPLAHGPVESTAFLMQRGPDALLCFGDTGADRIEHADRLHQVWAAAAPLVRRHALKAIIIETSFPNAQPEAQLFGHLTPKLLLEELHDLADQAGGPRSLQGLPVVIGHIKYTLKTGPLPQAVIRRELDAGNDLGVRFIIPEQGDRYRF
jgi:3',5'-cyclic-nucleotide phosphodiesterase